MWGAPLWGGGGGKRCALWAPPDTLFARIISFGSRGRARGPTLSLSQTRARRCAYIYAYCLNNWFNMCALYTRKHNNPSSINGNSLHPARATTAAWAAYSNRAHLMYTYIHTGSLCIYIYTCVWLCDASKPHQVFTLLKIVDRPLKIPHTHAQEYKTLARENI